MIQNLWPSVTPYCFEGKEGTNMFDSLSSRSRDGLQLVYMIYCTETLTLHVYIQVIIAREKQTELQQKQAPVPPFDITFIERLLEDTKPVTARSKYVSYLIQRLRLTPPRTSGEQM